MKFFSFNTASIATILLSQSGNLSVTAANDSNLRGTIGNADSIGRVLKEAQDATFLIALFEDGPDDSGRRLQGNSQKQTLNVGLDDGTSFEIKNAKVGWADGLESGVSRVRIPPGAIKSGGEIDMRGQGFETAPGPFKRDLEAEEKERTPEQGRNLAELQRQLAVVEGDRSILAVRVVHDDSTDTSALSALAPTYTQTQLADGVFGIAVEGPDPVNLHSQYLACSHGELNFQPAEPRQSVNTRVSDIVDGVVEVTVSSSCSSNCDGTIRNEVNSALASTFGVNSAASLANHVMHCLPPGAMGGIAYAYVNSWNSVYADKWCTYTSVQLHEIGHNINLAHSGEGSNAYADQSGFMGYSYNQDDQRMCFNNAKNWQLGWFSNESTEISLNESFVGNLKGNVNYGKGDGVSKVVIKVKDPSSSRAFYIGYNHRVKHNSDSVEAGNQVTIQEYIGDGYGKSTLIGKLGANTSWNLALGSDTVTVNVGSITTNAETGLAAVTITYGSVAAPTPPPTNVPTKQPTPAPTNPPVPPTPLPTNFPTNPPTPSPTKSPVPPTPSPTNFPTNPPTPAPTVSPTNPPTPPPTQDCASISDKNVCKSIGGCSWGGRGKDKVCS